MKINWKVRLRSKEFILALIAFIGLALSNAGVIDLGEYQRYADSLFTVLVAAGLVIDPTTDGLKDSELARTYKKPRSDLD